MTHLEDALRDLKKVEPTRAFRRDSKLRLMERIQLHENETWFKSVLKSVSTAMPSPQFITRARMRLVEQIHAARRPLFGWAYVMKRLVASTLVMVLAVTVTLFFVDGKQMVSASEASFLEVTSGQVELKHAEKLIGDPVTAPVDLSEGDLIHVGAGGSATIHFFDDSEVRLGENSALLIARLGVSHAYARQGVIEVSLNQGRVWVQTLNVDDGSAQFTLSTRDGLFKALNSSFDVSTSLQSPTEVRVFTHTLTVQPLRADTRDVTETVKLPASQQMRLDAIAGVVSDPSLVLTDADHVDSWIQTNLAADRQHLVALKEREIESLRASTGALPGDMLYPIKQAKERLALAFSFNPDDVTRTQMDIANQRMNEAIMLLQLGKKAQAEEALAAYQSLVRQIADSPQTNPSQKTQISTALISNHQKMLIASLPGDLPIMPVNEALNQTEELFAASPMDRETVRLSNALDRLTHVADLVSAGNLMAAKDALTDHQLETFNLLSDAKSLPADQQDSFLKKVLDMRQDEARLLRTIAAMVAEHPGSDPQFTAMLTKAGSDADAEVTRTIALITPIAPEVVAPVAVAAPEDQRVALFVSKVNIYKTSQGRTNQIIRLLNKDFAELAKDPDFLMQVRDQLDPGAQELISIKILDVQRQARLSKSKTVQRKIDRAVRTHEMRN